MAGKRTFIRLLKYMSNYRWLYVCLIFTMIVGTAVELMVAWFLSILTDAGVNHELDRWPFLISTALALIIIDVLNSYLDIYLKQKASLLVRNDLRVDTLNHVLRLPQAYFDNGHSGELLTRFTSDNQAVGEACGSIIMSLLKNPLLAIGAFIYLLKINWILALISIATGPLLIITGNLFGKSMRKRSYLHQEVISKSTSFLQDVLGASILYKTFGLEKKISHKFEKYSYEITKVEKGQGKVQGASSSVSNGIAYSTLIGTILLAGFFVAKGKLEVGAMLAFIQLMNYLVLPFSVLPGLWSSLQQAMAGAERIFEVMDASKEYEELPKEGQAQPSFRRLEVSGLYFSYNNSNVQALNNINFAINAGEKVAIVGASGGGKSTLFKILLGLYQPTDGSIEIDGRKIGSLNLREYRDYFSLVPQETILFTGTVRDNIKDGNLSAEEEDVVAAAKKANAYDFIMSLPQGFDTEIGEKGSRLSGGQRQRIAIARAILRDAPILLLDEATAALDNESEAVVQDALTKLMVGRTSLIIAHRLSTVQNADLILVMEDGTIVEQGTHAELIQKNGRYHSLYFAQLKGGTGVIS